MPPHNDGDDRGVRELALGHYFEPRCDRVYDRETGEVVPKPPELKFVWDVSRYYCGCKDEEIEDYKEKWKHALEKLEEYDDLMRFSEMTLKGTDIREMWEVEKKLMERLKETEDKREINALGKLIENIITRRDAYAPSEEFRKLLIKRYGAIPWK